MRLPMLLLISLALMAGMFGGALGADFAAASRVELAIETIGTIARPGRVEYATVWDGNKYVQCRRTREQSLRCEAAGTRLQPSLKHVLTATRLDRLNRLDWVLDDKFGNYVRIFPADMPASQIASAILQTLIGAYDADISQLGYGVSWVGDVACPPRNGPSQNLAGIVNDAESMQASAIKTCSYTPESELARAAASSEALIEIYGTRTTNEIQRLRVNLWHRSFAVFDAGIGYVQCAPDPSLNAIYCEAQSAESWPALASVLTEERISELRAAGYANPGRAPNFWKTYPLESVDDTAIAAEILTILHDVYGFSGAAQLQIITD